MRYTVIWKPPTEDRLAEIWLEAEDREAVTAASSEIDNSLREDPGQAGESRPNESRILIVPLLAVFFDVLEDDRQAVVYAVWRCHKKSKE